MRYIALIITLLFVSQSALIPCDCDEPMNTIEKFEKGWKSVDFILEIKIKRSLTKNDNSVFGKEIMEAEVLKLHKGEITSKSIKISSYNDGGGSCGYPFEMGKTYLFYGNQNEKGVFKTSICDRTGELKNKKFDLKLLAEH